MSTVTMTIADMQRIVGRLRAIEAEAKEARAFLESLPSTPPPPKPPPPPREIMFGIGYEKLFTGDEGDERLSLAEAMALRNVLGFDVMRYTVDMAAVNPSPSVYLFGPGTKLGDDMATIGAAELLPQLDLRYVMPRAVMFDGEPTKQCRTCTHAFASHPIKGGKITKLCTECRDDVEAKRKRPTVCDVLHWYMEADPRTAYMQGQYGPLLWNDWGDGSKGTHYAEELPYLRAGNVPHVNGEVLRRFSRELVLHFGDAIHAVNVVNEPDQLQYNPPLIDVDTAFREGKTAAEVAAIRAATVRRMRDEIAWPLADGIRSVSNRIKICYPSAATSTFLGAALSEVWPLDGTGASINAFGSHPYPWGERASDPLEDSIKTAEDMLTKMRLSDPEGRIERWFDEYDDGGKGALIGFAKWCMTQPDVSLLVFHQNRFWDEAEKAKGNFVPNALGRQLQALRS